MWHPEGNRFSVNKLFTRKAYLELIYDTQKLQNKRQIAPIVKLEDEGLQAQAPAFDASEADLGDRCIRTPVMLPVDIGVASKHLRRLANEHALDEEYGAERPGAGASGSLN